MAYAYYIYIYCMSRLRVYVLHRLSLITLLKVYVPYINSKVSPGFIGLTFDLSLYFLLKRNSATYRLSSYQIDLFKSYLILESYRKILVLKLF